MQKMTEPSKLILEKVRAFDDIPREIWIQFKDREDYAQKEQELHELSERFSRELLR